MLLTTTTMEPRTAIKSLYQTNGREEKVLLHASFHVKVSHIYTNIFSILHLDLDPEGSVEIKTRFKAFLYTPTYLIPENWKITRFIFSYTPLRLFWSKLVMIYKASSWQVITPRQRGRADRPTKTSQLARKRPRLVHPAGHTFVHHTARKFQVAGRLNTHCMILAATFTKWLVSWIDWQISHPLYDSRSHFVAGVPDFLEVPMP